MLGSPSPATSARVRCWTVAIATVLSFASASRTLAQQIQIVSELRESGTIRTVKPGMISIITPDRRVVTCKIQDRDEKAISVSGTPLRLPAKITVTGTLPATLLEKGMVVRFLGKTSQYGKSEGEVKQIQVLNQTQTELKVDFLERPEPGEAGKCEVVGRVMNLTKQKLRLQVPKSNWAKKERITFELAPDCTMRVADDDLNRVRPNDTVENLKIVKLSTGDLIAREIEIKMTADREVITTSFHEKLEQEFSDLSPEPAQPRELRSNNFVLYTDLSDRNANILLAKLETMHELIGSYFGKRPRIPVECYVVSDLSKWGNEKLHPTGVAKIMEPAGVTLTARHIPTGQAKSVVYSCDRHAVCQHEAVHAFCAQAFGSTGPVWYSEGMAELGQYWIPGELAVNIDPVVIEYLTTSEPKKMEEIVAAGQITGDSWQAYAWRWALCHLLANNPNYARRFKRLGISMMAGGDDSFERAFGKVADKISFEYDQFVENFGNGYRVDLCAWDWSVAASNLDSNGRTKSEIKAQSGWQPTKLEVREGVSYDFVAQGEWQLSPHEKLIDAEGYPEGRGKLVGVILHDYQLSEPIELGTSGSFLAPVTGQLYLRCRDDWTELADNTGEVTVYLRRSPKTE